MHWTTTARISHALMVASIIPWVLFFMLTGMGFFHYLADIELPLVGSPAYVLVPVFMATNLLFYGLHLLAERLADRQSLPE